MREPVALMPMLRQIAIPAICILATGYFGAHAVGGGAGWFAWSDYRAEKSVLAVKASERTAEKLALQQQVDLLSPKGADPDFAEELIRRNLGVMRPDEVIVPLDDK